MKTAKNSRKKIITKAFNRRISAVLAFILLFQTIFSGVEVRAEQAVPASQGAAISQGADAGQAGTSTMVPAGSLQEGTPSVSTNTDFSITQQDVLVPYPSGGYTLTIDKSGAWGGYAQYAVTITNTGKATLEDIALALPWQDAEVDAIWCATATKQDGTIYILPLEWCENLAPGASLAFGFIVKGDDDKLIPPEKHALITAEQVNAIKNGEMQPPVWEELQTPGPENTSEPATPSPQPAPTHTTEVEQTPAPTNTPYPTPTPTSEPTTAPTPEPLPTAEPTPTPTVTPTAEPSPGPLPTTEPTAVPTPEPAPTAEPTATPAPTTVPYLTTGITGTEPAAYGYTTPPAIQIQVTNIGQGTSLPFTLSLPDESAPFTILPPETNILAGGEHTTITVQVSTGLDAGLYTGTLILHVPGQPDTVIPLLQQIHKAAVLEPAEIRIAAITTDTITLAQISGYEYTINQEQDQAGEFQDSPVFTGLQPDTEYTLFMRKKEDKNHTAGQITTAQVRTDALPEPEPTPAPEPTETPGPATTPTAEPTVTPTALPTAVPSAKPTSVPAPTPEPCEDLYVDGSLTLTEPTTCRNLYMNGTRLDPNGYKLTVTGNIIQHSGTILGGTTENPLLVKGNYTQDGGMLSLVRGRHVRILGNYTQEGTSECRMRYDSGCLLDIRGNWTINTEEWNLLETGTIRLGGNLTQTSESSQDSLDMENAMNLILDGTAPQTVETAHGENSYLANLDLTQSHRVQFTKYIRARSLRGLGSIHNRGDLKLKITQLTLTQDETVHDDLVLLGGEIRTNGHTLTLKKNLTIKGGWLEASGEASRIKTGGSLTQEAGTLAILYGAQAHILGNYTMDGTATCRMRYDSGCLLDIRGNWTISTGEWNLLETGTIQLGGNLTQTENSHEQSLDLSRGMHLILDGSVPQTIRTAHESASYLADLNLQQAESIQFDQPVHAYKLDGLSRIKNPGILELAVENLYLTQDETIHGNLGLLSGEIRANGHTLTIKGNACILGGWLEATGETSCIKIDGSLTQEAGTLNTRYGAATHIKGNYQLAGSGRCHLRDGSRSLLDIRGNWTIRTEEQNFLETGTIRLGGNLTQTSESSQGSLDLAKYMQLILDGTASQTIQTAHEENSYLAKINITNTAGACFAQEIYATDFQGLSQVANTDELILHVNTLSPDKDETLRCDLILDGGDLRLYEHTLTIGGNLETWNADIRLASGANLRVENSLYQDGGAIRIEKGTLDIQGSYHLEDGFLTMQRQPAIWESGSLAIGGNWNIQTPDLNLCSIDAGTITLGGNLTQGANSEGYLDIGPLVGVTLSGTTTQKIKIKDHPDYTNLGTLNITQAAGVALSQPLRAEKLIGLAPLSPNKKTKIYADIQLTRDETLTSSLHILAGNLKLEENHLTVDGNLTFKGQELTGNALTVTGNYTQTNGRTALASLIIEKNMEIDGNAVLTLGKDCALTVQEDLRWHSQYGSRFTGGIVTLGGNLDIGSGEADGIQIQQDVTCTVKLTGKTAQHVYTESTFSWSFGTLDLTESAGVTFHDPLRVTSLKGWDKIQGNLTLGVCNVTLTGNETLHGSLSLNQTSLQFKGNTLTVYGGFLSTDSLIYMQAGTLIVQGNMDIEGISNLQMIHIKDLIEVYGNFSISTSLSQEELNNGTLCLHGDFWQGGQERSFDAVDKHKTYFVGTGEQHILFRYDETSQFANDDYARYNPNVIWDNDPADWLDATYYFCKGISNSVDLMAQLAELSEGLGLFMDKTLTDIKEDPAGFALETLKKAGIAVADGAADAYEYLQIISGGPKCIINIVNTAIKTYQEITEYYSDSTIGKCQKIEKTGEAFGGLCLLVIDIGTAVKDISPDDIRLMAEALETGSKTALAMAAGDARAMGQSLKHLLTKESVEAFAGMTKQEARYLTRAVESLAKETGDYVSDHLFATLRSQFEKGTSRTKAVKLAKNLFHKREAVGRMYDYLDDAARAALYELVEAEDVLQEEIEQLGKIAQTYMGQSGQTLKKTQLDDLLADSSLGAKSVEEVVDTLLEVQLQLKSGKDLIKNIRKVEYGSDDLSKVAIQFRKTNNITSARRNVCVVEYKDVDGTILKEAFISNASSHSEELMLEYLKENNILGKDIIKIFSEREPCVETATNIGHNCTNHIIEYMPDDEVVYVIEYGATRESGLNARNSLKKILEKLLN